MAKDPHSASPSQGETNEGKNAASNESAATATILLVEDNPTDIFVISEVLAKSALHFQLQIATDGAQALAYFQTGPDEQSGIPDLVLLDLNIPKVKGTEVLRKIRANARSRGVPVVVVTSSDSQADRSAAQNLGANAYFKKPHGIDEYFGLAGILQKLLGELKPPES